MLRFNTLFAGFEYHGLNNLGDNIQSIAVERLLPNVVQRFDRDTLAYANPEKPLSVVMNGWFSHHPSTCLPSSSNLHPIFWGFHITNYNNSWDYFSRKEVISYLKQYEPIGCRDPYTAERLSSLGVKTFVSYCLTLTFPHRKKEPENGKVLVVDAYHIPLPDKLKKEAICFSHHLHIRHREALKRLYAGQLLQIYRKEARLVITTRLHCLLPCIAMGIPVIFFNNPNDYRVSWVKELGVQIYSPQKTDQVNWEPVPIDFEKQKEHMIHKFLLQIENLH